MLYKLRLKNADVVAQVEDHVYEWLSSDPHLVKIDFLNNLRLHSSGCVFFQRTWRVRKGESSVETIYLHKIIAEKYLHSDKTSDKNLVSAINGDKLDCRLGNLAFRSRSVVSRRRKTTNNTGYTGVYKEGNRFRAVISYKGKPMHIGMFATVEEAARAYNAKSNELFGKEGKQNKLHKAALDD